MSSFGSNVATGVGDALSGIFGGVSGSMSRAMAGAMETAASDIFSLFIVPTLEVIAGFVLMFMGLRLVTKDIKGRSKPSEPEQGRSFSGVYRIRGNERGQKAQRHPGTGLGGGNAIGSGQKALGSGEQLALGSGEAGGGAAVAAV